MSYDLAIISRYKGLPRVFNRKGNGNESASELNNFTGTRLRLFKEVDRKKKGKRWW